MNKTVLITGTSTGLGKSAAKVFAANGWNVIATMRSPEKEQELTKPDNVFVTKLDVQDPETIEKAVSAGIDRFGKIDVLVNNAGYGAFGVFESTTRQQMQKQFDVNVFGLMDVTRAVLPHMRSNKKGIIINISSMGGRITLPLTSLYHASKFAIEGFSESLSYELGTQNIAVKLVEPGVVQTNFYDEAFIPNTVADYDALVAAFTPRFSKQIEPFEKASSDEVGQIIYEAATDGTNRLRYLVGADAKFFVDGKMNNSDQEYMDLMRGYFIDGQ